MNFIKLNLFLIKHNEFLTNHTHDLLFIPILFQSFFRMKPKRESLYFDNDEDEFNYLNRTFSKNPITQRFNYDVKTLSYNPFQSYEYYTDFR